MSNFERKVLPLLTDDMLEHADTLNVEFDKREKERETLGADRRTAGILLVSALVPFLPGLFLYLFLFYV